MSRVTRALDRNVGSDAHGDADIGGGERRRVVHGVSRHGDDAAFLAQARDDLALVFRQDFRIDFRDAELAGDSVSRGLVVPGQHHHPDALVEQRLQAFMECWSLSA